MLSFSFPFDTNDIDKKYEKFNIYPDELDNILVEGCFEELEKYGFYKYENYRGNIFFIPSKKEWENNISNVYTDIEDIEQFGYRLNPPNKYQLDWLKNKYKKIDNTYIPYKCELISSWYCGCFNIYFNKYKFINIYKKIPLFIHGKSINKYDLDPYIKKGYLEEIMYIFPEYLSTIYTYKYMNIHNLPIIPSKNEWINNTNNIIDYDNTDYIKGIEQFNPRVAPPTEEQLIWLKEYIFKKYCTINVTKSELIEFWYTGYCIFL